MVAHKRLAFVVVWWRAIARETTTTATGKGSIVDATNIVSNRSLGSLASVGDMFGQQKQKLTGSAVFAIFVGAIAGLLFGFDQNVFNLIFDETAFRATMGMPPAVEQCGPAAGTEPLWVSNRIALIQALYPIGCAAASPFAGTMNDRFGRYKTLWVGMAIFFLGAALQTAANDWPMLMAGRVIAGMSVGILSSVVPVYIGELAPAHLRGGLGSLFQVGITFGAVFATVWCMILQSTIHGVNYVWRLETGMQLVIGLVMAVSMLFIPESPRFLAKNGQNEKARNVLRKLRGDAGEEVTEAEMKEIEVEVAMESKMTARVLDLFSKEVRFATMVALTIPIMQQFTGINVLMGFSATIFNSMCLDGNTVTLVQNIVNLIATCTVVLYFSDRVGRKSMLVLTSAFIFVIWVIGCSLLWTLEITKNVAYGIAVLNAIYVATFALAWGPNGWVIPNEVLPLRLRGLGCGFATFNNWIFNFIVSYTAPIAQNRIGFAGNMMIYAVLMLLSCPLLFFLMPETKGVPLEEMEEKFNVPLKTYVKNNATDLRRRRAPEAEEPEQPAV